MTLVAYADRVERDGQTVYTENGGDDPLKWAIVESLPGEKIILHYKVPKMISIGVGENYRRFEAVRNVPFDFKIEGAKEGVGTRAIQIGDKGGGVEHAVFTKMTMDFRGALRGFTANMDTYGGRIAVRKVRVRSDPKTQMAFRLHGSYEHDFVDVHCPDGGKEWPFYCDWHRGDSKFVNCSASGWGRGGIQRDLRDWPNSQTVMSDDAYCLIERCKFYDYGAAGAAGISLTGFWGKTEVIACVLESDHKTGGIYANFDNKQTELTDPSNGNPKLRGPIIGPGRMNEDLRAGGELNIQDPSIQLLNTDRSAIMVDSMAKLRISSSGRGRNVESNKWLVDLEPNGNGKTKFFDKSIGEFKMRGDFSDWKSPQGYRRRGNEFSPE